MHIISIKNLEQYTPASYFDWFITTPTMLLSTIIFMKYSGLKEHKQLSNFTVTDFIKNNKQTILKLFVYNALMLVFGYLGETKVILICK